MLKQFTPAEKGWIFYDWANSAYSILVASLLPIYFTFIGSQAGVSEVKSTSDWGFTIAISAMLIALSAPILGSLADYKGMRKKLFSVFFILGTVCTFLLPFISSYTVLLLLYALTNIGFAGANIFYDAFLVDVTTNERIDKVSSWGFGMGYIGGSTIPFIVSILLVMFGDSIGLDQIAAIKISCIITALWWALFTLPFLKNVKQLTGYENEPSIFTKSFKRLAGTLREITQYKQLLIFYIAYFCYINGVGAIIMMASKLASSIVMPDGTIGFNTLTIIGGLFLTQIVAFPCSIAYHRIGNKIGYKNMILIGIATYILVSAIGFFMIKEWHFILLACLVGTAQGGVQALSRSFYAKLIPDKSKSGEFFGFYSVFGKFESVLGTLLMAIVLTMTDDVHYGIIPVLGLFVIGGLLMLKVKPLKNESIKNEE